MTEPRHTEATGPEALGTEAIGTAAVDTKALDTIAFDNIDRLINVEMRSRILPRGLKWRMFELARAAAGRSLVAAAAQAFDRPPARVLLLSGAAVPGHMPVGENDGPIGSVVLARALTRLGHAVSILTDPVAAVPFRGLLRSIDVEVPVLEIGLDEPHRQQELADAHNIVCAIERLGGNRHGIIYGATGHSRAPFRANLDALVRRARATGKCTIGIGDGGNEIGFGNIHAAMMAELGEFAHVDVTPCGGGVYSAVETDILLVANTSNMGAHAVTAGLALLRGDLSLCHTADEELALAHVGVGLGLIDGGTGKLRPWCDGIPTAGNAAVVEVMRTIVSQALLPPDTRKF